MQRWFLPIEFTEAANAVINASSQRHLSLRDGDDEYPANQSATLQLGRRNSRRLSARHSAGDDEHSAVRSPTRARRNSVTSLRGAVIELKNGAHVEEEHDTIAHAIVRPATISKRRFTKFYASPLVKFLLDTVSHGCLLVTYTICVLADFRQPVMNIEIVLLAWKLRHFSGPFCTYFQGLRFPTRAV